MLWRTAVYSVPIMKTLLSYPLFACCRLPVFSGRNREKVPTLMNDVAGALEGARLIVESPASANYTQLVKTYSHVTSDG